MTRLRFIAQCESESLAIRERRCKINRTNYFSRIVADAMFTGLFISVGVFYGERKVWNIVKPQNVTTLASL